MLGSRNEARRADGDGVADCRLLVPELLRFPVSRRAGQHRYGQLGPVSRQVSVFHTGTYLQHTSLRAYYLPL